MSISNALNNQRPELLAAVQRGEEKICGLIANKQRALRSGETLVAAGEEHNYVYRLRKGWVGRTRTLPDGRTQYILIFLPGDLFAVKSMFVREHPDAIEALSEASVDCIGQGEMRRFYETDSDIALRCMWQVIEEERRLHSWVVSLGRGEVSERLAYLLLQFRFRLAACGAIGKNSLVFEVPMTQQQLADFLGISLVYLNRTLMKLRDANLVRLQGRMFTIIDLDALGKVAYPLLDASEIAMKDFAGADRQADERRSAS